jgi:hypothetical protein
MRYFLGLLVALGLIILIVFLMFGGGKSKIGVATKPLESYNGDNDAVRLTIDGPVNADQDHMGLQITVNNSDVVYEQLQGYQDSVVNQQTFSSNQQAYNVFLRALDLAGFTRGNPAKDLSNEQGYCSLGDRYIFELLENGNDVERYWATNCGNPKTYLGNLDLTLSLFEDQVPNYSELTENVRLNL